MAWIVYILFTYLLNGPLSCLPLSAIMNNDAMNIEMKISTWVPAFSSSDYVPKSRIAGSYSNSL